MKKQYIGFLLRMLLAAGSISGSVFLFSAEAAALTVTPNTWNVVGLDSNTPLFGPNRFPVGAKVCGGTPGQNVQVDFFWDSTNPYVYLRPGSANPINVTLGADGCADAYFEVEVDKNSGNAPFDTNRQYHISAGGVSTPMPREIYVEHLVSQSRNYITNVEVNGASVPAGGAMNLLVGNTYTIKLYGGTATQGYQQFEEFINFPNTIFQVLSVTTSYSADDSPYVPNPNDKLYADACKWENNPNSPFYLSCVGGDYKAGGNNVVTTYTVKIVGGGGSSETLSTLLYDFSGSSFHYNADYSTGARVANIIDPATLTIAKSFGPNPTNVGGASTLTFTITNPNAGALSGLSFTDVFPTLPGNMTLSSVSAGNTCGGTLTDHLGNPLAVGSAGIRLTGGTAPANGSCTVQVNVTTDATGSYANTSGHLFVNSLDTGKYASDTLTVNSTPPPPPPAAACSAPVELARWEMPTSGQGSGGPPPPYTSKAADVLTATTSYVTVSGAQSITSISGHANAWGGTAPTGGGGWSETPTSMNNYFQFVLDTSNYGGVRATFDVGLFANSDWASPNSPVYVNTSADGGGFTVYQSSPGVYPTGSKGSWAAGLFAAAASTGTNTTTFRFGTNGSGSNKPAATMYLDNIIFTGCTRPDSTKLSLIKSFSVNPVAVNGTSRLTFSISNTNDNSTAPLTGITFTDPLPAGLQVAATPNATTTCGGSPTWAPAAGNTTLAFGSPTGTSLAPGASCQVSVDITATTAGPHENVSGFVSSTESGQNTSSSGVAKATLTAVLPPSISKQFAPDMILAGGTSTLTFLITNPNQNDALGGVAFSDTFPATMVVGAPATYSTSGCGAPTFTPVAGAGAISFTSGTIAAGGTCTVTVDVTATATGANTSGNVSHIINAATVNGNTATDTLTITPPHPAIYLLKKVATNLAGPWYDYLVVDTLPSNVYYRFTVENAGDVDLASVYVSDPDFNVAGKVPGCSWGTLTKYDVVTCDAGPVSAASGSHQNIATVNGDYGGTNYPDTDYAFYATSGLSLAKNVTQSSFSAAGNVLNYSYDVTNSGAAILDGPVTVADDKTTVTCPAVSTAGDFDEYLDPGEALTCTATYTVTAADVTAKQVTNTASASTTAGEGTPAVTSNTDSRTVPLAPDLTATKTNNVGGSVTFGNTFSWTLTVGNAANAGTATFADGQTLLTDDLPTSGATYAVGAVTKAGTAGTINCVIGANTLSCTASGAVTIPSSLQGTVSVTNASATVTGAGTAFTTQLAAGSIISINGVRYTVLSIQSDTQLTLAAIYAGATAGGLVIPASFSVPVTVTPTAGGSLVNPKSGGACKANPAAAIAEIDQTNNDCADTVTVLLLPSLTVVKSVQAFSDPVNGTTNPKAIPGSVMQYTIQVVNTGPGTVDVNTTVITDPIPANTELFVGDINGAGSGPVLFTDGAIPSGLSYSFIGLASAADSLSFSGDGGVSYNKNDTTADANQCDSTVTHLRISLGGIFSASDGTNHPSFNVKFKVRVK